MAKDIRESPHSFTFGADDLSKTSDFDLDARLRGEVIKMLVIFAQLDKHCLCNSHRME